MSEKTWAHLPNAQHIDAVLADVRKRPKAWRDAWGATTYEMWHVAWKVAKPKPQSPHSLVVDAVNTELGDRQGGVPAAMDAIYALLAWDSSADLLDCTPDVLRTMIDLAEPPVCHQAALLLPYAIVRSNDK